MSRTIVRIRTWTYWWLSSLELPESSSRVANLSTRSRRSATPPAGCSSCRVESSRQRPARCPTVLPFEEGARLRRNGRSGPAMEVAEGIVVIDELGAHLHPRWRMRIVASLCEVFPRVQFVASTHDPLCLRGLFDGKVTVLRRDAEQGVVSITDLPPIAGLRVDQF
jgi:hypothetical protein